MIETLWPAGTASSENTAHSSGSAACTSTDGWQQVLALQTCGMQGSMRFADITTLLQAGLHLLHKTMLLLHGSVDGSQVLRQICALLHSLLMLLLQLLELGYLQAVHN